MTDSPLISVVSPVYGCTSCLEELSDRVRHAFHDTEFRWELILVDDRGPNPPWPVIEQLSKADDRVKGIRLTRNHGQHLAIWAGLEAAKGDWVVVLDCDLQDDPAAIPELYKQAQADGVEAVQVARGEWSDSLFRRMASNMFQGLLTWLSGMPWDKTTGIFGLYSRRMIDTLLSYEEKEVFFPLMVLLTGLSRSKYEVPRSDRHSGQSSYNLLRLARMAVAIIVRFSDRPLKLSVLVGATFSSVSVLVSIYLLFAWMVGAITVPGWTSLILSVWFLAGLILAVLGIHGFYIGRMFAEVKRRPRILVEQTTDPASSR